ncbi:hypothetical protein BM86_19010 [Bacillus thuringiensis]|uniref:Plasmid pRiA4b Orf3-like domain-containing protein n=1 Tax=Bacillus thuringiensis TaxID=1428 RepID=A0A9W3SJ04_BACTU|nr:hypothetical protein [Bacillus thuringiensis]ANS52343.1 hypothetical protein BT246_70520 [Bacillus thuringiensis]MBH0337512.1 hypothetical protein [Bacillus thuringiensis]
MKCYQLHLELVGCPFPIWRKVVLPAKLTFDDLHDVIQCLFQWEHQHLFEFTVGKYTIWVFLPIPSKRGNKKK